MTFSNETSPYLQRTLDSELSLLMPYAPAIAIDGPKGVGKTGTASRHADAIFYLDRPEQQNIMRADPSFTTAPAGSLLFDEWQYVPEVWNSVRRQVDQGAPPGRFLLTGSASPLAGVDTHSGAGRILSLRMRPLTYYERYRPQAPVSLAELLMGDSDPIAGQTTQVTLEDYFKAIVSSGFPGIFQAPQQLRRRLLDAYLQRVIDRDLPDSGYAVRHPETLRRWLTAYAAASSTTTSYSRILDATTAGDGSQPAKTTTAMYRDFLTKLWLLDPVPGWVPINNEFTKLAVSPKHQLADPALAARLLGLGAQGLATAQGAHMAGPLFESLVTLSVRTAAQAAEATVSHLRTPKGDREVDLIVQGPEGQVLGVEVKLTASVTDADVRHLLWLREKAGSAVTNLMVVTTGSQAYRRQDGVAVVPLALLAE
ncbi:ATP-binding protein [Rothia endophytica]|uniref:ATP-binding protein n=1 Tax=Rothia endophytica TaxID=1324766 RepID=UPI001F2D35CC|nr:AAA family ATPase [Rothia endophytica]